MNLFRYTFCSEMMQEMALHSHSKFHLDILYFEVS